MALDWTDQTEVIKRRQQAIQAGYSPEDVDKFIKQKQAEQAQLQLTQQGVLDVGELAKSNPQLALQATKQGAKPAPSKETEAQKTKSSLATSGLKSLGKVEQFLEKDPNLPVKQLIPGKLASRSFDSALFGAVDTLLRIRTGATAPEEEIRRYMSAYGPQAGDSPEDVAFKINQLKTALVSEGGLSDKMPAEASATSQQFPPESIVNTQPQVSPAVQRAQQNVQAMQQQQMNPIERLLNPVAQGPVGAGAEALLGLLTPSYKKALQQSAQGKDVSLGQGIAAGGELAASALPFANIGKLGLAAKGGLAGVTRGATQENESLGGRLMETGKEGLTGLFLGGIPGALGKGAGAVKSNFSFKGIGAKRDAAVQAAKEVTVSGDDLVKAANEYLENDPLAKGVANKILPSIEGKQITLPNLMKKIDVWNDAYTQAGKVGKSAEAGLNNVLARKAKDLVSKAAPKVTEANKAFSRRYEVGKYAKKAAGAGILGGAGYSGYQLIDMLLGGKGN